MGLQDRYYVKRSDNSRRSENWENLKPNGDDMQENSVRIYKRSDVTPLWAHIAVGILVAAIFIVVAKVGWDRY